MQRYKIVLQYFGSNYIGWQRQKEEARSTKHSVQWHFEKALSHFGEFRGLCIAGRTDTGVHALGNVCSVDLVRRNKRTGEVKEPLCALSLKLGMNQLLNGRDIHVCHVEAVDFSFNARHSALERTYQFKILNTPERNVGPFERNRLWVITNRLDYDKMQEACKLFEGTHDLSTFHSRRDQDRRAVRTVNEFGFTVEKNNHYYPWAERYFLTFTVRAPSFMMYQVRKMVGAVAAVGTRNITISQLQEIIESKDPSKAPPMAPPDGLYLVDVKYPQYRIKDSSTVGWTSDGRPTKAKTPTLPIDEEMRLQLKIWEERKKEKGMKDQEDKQEELEKMKDILEQDDDEE